MAHRAEPNHDGILLVDKPQGWTSHDVVAKVRRLAGQRQVGHTGTLDPMATGLLVVCMGHATRLAEYMVGHDKRYEGEITLGAATSTDDAEGEVSRELPIPDISPARLAAVERDFTGVISQRPPAYSAIKVAGQRAYAVARKGGTPALEPRSVTIYSLSLASATYGRLTLRVHCGAGTYVRSLARDIGEALGTAAHLSALRRTAVAAHSVVGAWTLDELSELAGSGRLGVAVLASDEGITGMEAAILTAERATLVAHGLRIRVAAARESGALRIYDTAGEFVGIGSLNTESILRPVKVLTH